MTYLRAALLTLGIYTTPQRVLTVCYSSGKTRPRDYSLVAANPPYGGNVTQLIFGSKEANEILARETGRRFDLADIDPLSGRHNPGLAAPDEDDYAERYCTVCGGYMDWVECWQCGGAGEFDLYDEDPTYYDEGDTEKCDECKGAGGYRECSSLPHEESEATP